MKCHILEALVLKSVLVSGLYINELPVSNTLIGKEPTYIYKINSAFIAVPKTCIWKFLYY